MDVVTYYLTIALGGIFLGVGLAKVFRAPSMLKEARRLGFSVQAYRAIGAAEFAAAIGMMFGLRWPLLGVATAGALLALMAGALWALRRAGDGFKQMLPALFTAALAVATIVMTGMTKMS